MNGLSGNYRFPLYAWFGFAVIIFAHVLLILNLDRGQYQLYNVVWWPYILLVDGLVYRRKGSSLLTHRRKEFFRLLPWSLSLWLVFELLNVALNNWQYIMVPTNLAFRFRKKRIRNQITFRDAFPGIVRVLLTGLTFLIFSLFVFQMIDLHSVASWRP